MPPSYRWQHPHGIETLNRIVSKKVPEWSDGLRPAQLEYVPAILDREDVLCIEVTGGGKSAAFSVPILVHNEVSANPSLYPGFLAQEFAVGIVVTPTKGLAGNLVKELENMGIRALAYTSRRKAQAHRNNEKLAEEIASCTRWQVICVDPEHLCEDDWRCTIARSPVFREHLIYACAEEGHLMREWGETFRKAFEMIGVYFRGCLPSSISIFTLSATLAPGKDTRSVCKTLGFTNDNFKIIRHSNERVNTQIIFAPLSNGIGGSEFPQIFDYLTPGRKTIIHCFSKDLVLRVYLYLWKQEPPHVNHLRRVRMFHSTCSDEYNQETLRLLDTDPYCQIVVATVAFANGINVRTLLDSISIGAPNTVNELVQQKGRVGRIKEIGSRGILLIQSRQITQAKKQLTLTDAPPTSVAPKKTATNKTTKPIKPLEDAKARLLSETVCLIAALNREYDNPPQDPSLPPAAAFYDCKDADRRYWCSYCCERYGRTFTFDSPVYPEGTVLPAAFLPPASKSKTKHADKISKEDRIQITRQLQDLATTIWRENHAKDQYRHLPRSAFLPPSISKLVLSHIRSTRSHAALLDLIGPLSWRFMFQYSTDLFKIMSDLQATFRQPRQSKGKRRRVDSDEEEEEVDLDDDDEEPPYPSSDEIMSCKT
ncbi:P-loop containing nucleoside triphosphate hydrolase protein [Hymenopellis radicata]|nr:P-loop containing nucleoside triphosphate hydrolase protein [Hymenopellis radicata]